MPHRVRPARLGLRTEAGGAVRIAGPYPPPPPPPSAARTPVGDADGATGIQAEVQVETVEIEADIEALLARPPIVTRYGTARARSLGSAGPHAARAWTATSAVLAAAGIAAVVLLPQQAGPSARLDVLPALGAAAVTPTPLTAGSPAGQDLTAASSRQLPASDPVRIGIPALGVTSDIMTLGLERDGSMEVPPGAYPVGWYDGSPTPGQRGPAVLAGHVDWQGEAGAFYGLRDLRSGDTVVIERMDGTVATFRVDRVEEHLKDDFPTDDVYGYIDHPGLRLITCGGAFDEDTGDYQSNVIVFASLAATS
jgi:hypothetical protein